MKKWIRIIIFSVFINFWAAVGCFMIPNFDFVVYYSGVAVGLIIGLFEY